MSNKFGITDSLLDAVKGVSSQRVGQYTLGGINEAKNAPSKENGGIAHMCASHVQHATYGEGVCIPEQHTIVETAPGEGYVTHYDVDFSGNIVENVPVEDLEIVKESSHMHSNVKKDKKKMIAGQKMDEKMSSKEKMKRGLYNSKMDPVGKADADIDNDGDVDKSDSYLKNRRKAISKAMGKDKVKINPEVKEETKVDSKLENPHNCATHVYSEQWGDGRAVTTMHADPDEYGQIAWYDVMFEHGIEQRVPIEELKVLKSSMHGHKKRGK